jgi:phosphoribosylanthranilate isomerase
MLGRQQQGRVTLSRVMTKVKICGLTRLEDAALAVEQGAWALGMILWPASPRYCPPERAAEIADAHRRSAEIVGVFVDQKLDDVVDLTNELGLSIVQLHGDEGQKFCTAVAHRTGARVMKAFRVKDRSVIGDMGKFWDVDFHLLDTYVAGVPGGTGITFDWSFLREYPRRGDVPLILSGGLTPENVGEAITKVEPYAVDVSSGVESSPGIKDHDKVKAFFAAVREAVTTAEEPEAEPLTGADEEVLTLLYHRRIEAEKAREIEAKAFRVEAYEKRKAEAAAAAEAAEAAKAESPEGETPESDELTSDDEDPAPGVETIPEEVEDVPDDEPAAEAPTQVLVPDAQSEKPEEASS